MTQQRGGHSWPVLVGLLCCLLAVTATQAAELFRFTDVRGDDRGAGSLLYPNRPDLQRGDLDLAAFAARSVADGVWFVVEMAQPIRSPAGAVTQFGVPIDRLARHGFYTFNVDVYIDQDRSPGSGNVQGLPGRKVDIAPEFAWERSVILTPRPDVARTLMQTHLDGVYERQMRAAQGRVGKAEIARIQARSRAQIREHYFFPDRVQVSGRTVEFFVPAAFLGGAQPQPDWGYTVIVTGADLEHSARTGLTANMGSTLMTLPLARGIHRERFGIRSDSDLEMAPVVDLLSSDPAVQSRVLLDYDSVAGRLARIPGVSLTHMGTPPDLPAPVTRPAAPAVMIEPPPHAAKSDIPQRADSADESIASRLRSLQQLRNEGLVTPEEYDQLRRRILSELYSPRIP